MSRISCGQEPGISGYRFGIYRKRQSKYSKKHNWRPCWRRDFRQKKRGDKTQEYGHTVDNQNLLSPLRLHHTIHIKVSEAAQNQWRKFKYY